LRDGFESAWTRKRPDPDASGPSATPGTRHDEEFGLAVLGVSETALEEAAGFTIVNREPSTE
jgi:hypothetical protein